MIFLSFGINLSSQEHKKWTVSLSENCGYVENNSYDLNKYFNITLIPSIRYNFTPNISLGVSALLPLAKANKDSYSYSYTTGGELYLKGSFEVWHNLKLSLSAVGLVGITGPYKVVNQLLLISSPFPPDDPRHKNIEVKYQSYRWLVGLRPSISYNFNDNWSLKLGYGFLGYRSNKELGNTAIVEGSDPPKGAWGFNSEMGWGNGFRIGIGYSF